MGTGSLFWGIKRAGYGIDHPHPISNSEDREAEFDVQVTVHRDKYL